MEIDEYVDWHNAKAMLVDIAQSTAEAIRLCDVMLVKAGAIKVYDEFTSSLMGSIDLTDDQIAQISTRYTDIATGIKIAAETLIKTEMNKWTRKA